jgi:hypothetical protein
MIAFFSLCPMAMLLPILSLGAVEAQLHEDLLRQQLLLQDRVQLRVVVPVHRDDQALGRGVQEVDERVLDLVDRAVERSRAVRISGGERVGFVLVQ